MVKDTGDASERFLRSVAFGEVDMKEARAEGHALFIAQTNALGFV